MLFLLFSFFLYISLSYSNNLFFSESKSILNNFNKKIKIFDSNETENFNYLDIFMNLYNVIDIECQKQLKAMDPKEYNISNPLKYPVIFGHIGLTINDIEDENECLNSLNGTIYVIVQIKVQFKNNDDSVLLNFLNLTSFSVGGCATEHCKTPLLNLAKRFQSFSNEQNPIDSKEEVEPDIITASDDDKSDYENLYIVLFWVLISYLCVKLIAGIYSLVTMQKGYELYVAKNLNGELPFLNDNNNNFNEDSLENEELNISEYDPKYDLSSFYPKYLRILRFLDIFNDIMLLTKRKNRYYNDNGLECINFLRVIVLLFYIFSNTFTTLLVMPSKDILNKAFFSSNFLFYYRFSTYAGTSWIFLEGTYTAYKLMKFFNFKMSEYYRESKNKRYEFKVFIIFLKFMFLFIPKICMFLFCFYIFYYDINKFRELFKGKTTFKYIVERVITKDIECTDSIFTIFTSFFTFKSNISYLKKCYDFTFIYINILFCTLFFIISLYIVFLIRKAVTEIFFMLLSFIFFFGLTLIIEDDNNDSEIYSYYHFKGQEYANKIAYISIGVYNLGFILGLILFNYDLLKNKTYKKINNNQNQNITNERLSDINKNGKQDINSPMASTNSKTPSNKTNSSYKERAYYPLSFLNHILIRIQNIKIGIKILIIFICLVLQLLLSYFFKIYSFLTKNKSENDSKKDNDSNFDRNYVLEMKYNWVLKGYFLFEKHIFLLLFFIICIIMITFPKDGLFYSLISSKLITVISRTGFTIICLSHILSNFFFTGLIKIKFSIISFITVSTGDFLIIFIISFMINIVFELPLRRIIKKISRLDSSLYNNKKKDKIIKNIRDENSLLSGNYI